MTSKAYGLVVFISKQIDGRHVSTKGFRKKWM